LILTLCKHADSSRANYEGWSPYCLSTWEQWQQAHTRCTLSNATICMLDEGQTNSAFWQNSGFREPLAWVSRITRMQ
jgi:hypothetical protein